jgi:hypothetical protein
MSTTSFIINIHTNEGEVINIHTMRRSEEECGGVMTSRGQF